MAVSSPFILAGVRLRASQATQARTPRSIRALRATLLFRFAVSGHAGAVQLRLRAAPVGLRKLTYAPVHSWSALARALLTPPSPGTACSAGTACARAA